MIDEEDLILLAQEVSRQQQPILTNLKSINETLQKQNLRANKSLRLQIDLTRAHNDEPLKALYVGRKYLWLTIERMDSPFTYRLGQEGASKSEPFNASVSTSLSLLEFTEVYITNVAAVGIGVILLGWRE